MSRLAMEPATRLAVLLVFVIFCLRLPLLLVPLLSPPLPSPLSAAHSPLRLLCCSPVYVHHIKLSIYCCKIVARCFLLLALPLAFLQTTPSHTHTPVHTHAETQAKCISVHCALSFRGFCYYCWQQFRRHADETTGVSACDLALALALPLPQGDGLGCCRGARKGVASRGG